VGEVGAGGHPIATANACCGGTRILMHSLLRELLSFDLPLDDWALFGSGPLLARGWIGEVGDLDVLARGPAWRRAHELGEVFHDQSIDIDLVRLGTGITVGDRWAIGNFDTDQLIDSAEEICSIPCVALKHVVAYKRLAGRPKDRAHLEIIELRLQPPQPA
jgi:hypothetical protein